MKPEGVHFQTKTPHTWHFYLSGKRDSNADACGQHPDFPDFESQGTSGPAIPSGFFRIKSTSFFLERFFNFLSRIIAEDRSGFETRHTNFQGTPACVAFSHLLLWR
jgi:hypothetical protein